ncbi:DUF4040 domain-containing protein, partial [bacterium]|nr:DUF4040 domain-containing protein [bacterium]
PVSAYLHCATMVKLGIFLSARIFPIFVGTDLWGPLLISAGFITMVVGSILAYSSHDLKSILAYSTVAQLGFLIGFYGLGTPVGVQHDYFHVLNHVFYKGSLFMIAGIIDHAAGTRDIRKLGGLFKVMPLAGIAFIIMNLSMAGIPGTMGFVSKELVITQLTQYSWYIRFPLMFALFTYAMFMVAFSIRLFKNTFFGTMSEEVKARLHKPSFLFQLPAILPVFLVLLFGLFPNLLGHALEQLSVVGLQAKTMSHLALWHGFNKPLFLSFIIICHGVGFYIVAQRKQWKHVFIPKWLKFDDAFNFLYDKMVYHAKTVTTALLGNSSFNFLPVIIVSSLTLLSGYFIYLLSTGYDFAFGALVMPGQLAIFVTLLIVLGIVGKVFYTTWIKKLIALSVTGFMITFYFILYRAPDLALTQLLIETVSLILVLLFLTRLPKEDNIKNKTLKLGKTNQFFAILSSVAIGVIVFVSILMVTGNPNANPMGKYFIDNTLPLAQGSNAVNTILVDFRGYDTMGEITVLVIALLGVLGLVMRKRGRTSHVARLTSLDE